MPNQRRLSGADISGDHRESGLTAQRILDHTERKAMLAAHEEEGGIRLEREWALRHAVEGFIHSRFSCAVIRRRSIRAMPRQAGRRYAAALSTVPIRLCS